MCGESFQTTRSKKSHLQINVTVKALAVKEISDLGLKRELFFSQGFLVCVCVLLL